MVRMLLDYGANANRRRSCAKPALTIAVGKSNLEIMKMILEHGKVLPDSEMSLIYCKTSPELAHIL